MVDRGQFELAHITNRLLSSRDRPKRQYLIERIGHMWAPPDRCGIIRMSVANQAHAEPTHESVSAVASFERDGDVNVRIAVTFALRQHSVPTQDSEPVLTRLLADTHPFVRINAAHTLKPSALRSLAHDIILAGLEDETWSVRWRIAEALAPTDMSDRGWMVLRTSCPRHTNSLLDWLKRCVPFADRFAADQQLVTDIRNRIQSLSDDGYMQRELTTTLRQLLGR